MRNYWVTLSKSLAVLLCALAATLLLGTEKVAIDTGDKGVLWKRFSEERAVYDPGIYRVNRFDTLYIYDIELQQRRISVSTIDINGNSVSVSAMVSFQVVDEKLDKLHANVGPNYIEVLVLPQMSAVIRQRLGANDFGFSIGKSSLMSNALILPMIEESMRGLIKIKSVSELSVSSSPAPALH